MLTKIEHNPTQVLIVEKLKAYFESFKPRLTALVSFSAAFGYLMAVRHNFNWISFTGLIFGGFCVSGCGIMINQMLERNIDKLMQRTQNRPLPSLRVGVVEVFYVAFITGLIGFFTLALTTNYQVLVLSMLSLVLYSFVYTPCKRIGSFAVYVGAIPGALPPVLGWVAVTNSLDIGALLLFLLQFVWQFPHFWAIAWVLDDDYQKANFRLLPLSSGRTLGSALYILFGNLLLIPIGLLPAYFGFTGYSSAVIAVLFGVLFTIPSVLLLRKLEHKMALAIMFSSFIYLPVVQIAFLLDKL